tara:strand:- start:20116 stop:20310 length:195 start_codon:yes stop_codon:yes gene_type:complete
LNKGINSRPVDIQAHSLETRSGEFNKERQTNVSKPDDSNTGLSCMYFLENAIKRHNMSDLFIMF